MTTLDASSPSRSQIFEQASRLVPNVHETTGASSDDTSAFDAIISRLLAAYPAPQPSDDLEFVRLMKDCRDLDEATVMATTMPMVPVAVVLGVLRDHRSRVCIDTLVDSPPWAAFVRRYGDAMFAPVAAA